MASTIHGAGKRLFLKPHITIAEDFYLPYSGILATELTDPERRDDKLMEIRDGIYVKGSVQYSFSTTNNIYTNLVAMCNERVSQDMIRSNQSEITDSGLVRMQRLSSGDRPIEVTLIYSSLPMTIAELRSEIPYRKHVRRSTLLSLWSVMDQILDRLAFPWYNEMRSSLLRLLDGITLGNQDLDSFRGTSVSDPTRRFVQQCISVVDGTFMDILQQNSIFSSVKTGRTVHMNMSEQVIPEMILLHLFSIYFIGHYSDLRPKIDSYDVSNFILMAQVMRDLGVLITSSTKMTRLVRQSKYGGSATFTYLHFQIKYGNNFMLSTHDDLDDHVQCIVQPDNSKSVSVVDVVVRQDKLVSTSSS